MISIKLNSFRNVITAWFIMFFTIFGLALTPASVYAEQCQPESGILGFPTWYRGLTCDGIKGETYHVVDDHIPKIVWTAALNVLDMLLHVAGIVAIFMILLSAFKYLTNGGNQQKVAGAKSSLLKAVVGLAIALLASTAVGFAVTVLIQGW